MKRKKQNTTKHQTQNKKPYHKKPKIPGRGSNRQNLGREAEAGERNMSQEAAFQSKGEKQDKNQYLSNKGD